MATSRETAGTSTETARVDIRVPPFFPANPKIWFLKLEAEFYLNGVTEDSTRYLYAMSSLEGTYAEEVSDIITNPPSEGKYDTLKKELISRLAVYQKQKIRHLLEHEQMGGKTPSQFLHHLRGLAGEAIPDSLLRTLWSERLPRSLHPMLATQADDIPLNKVAILADQVHEVEATAQLVRIEARLEELREEIAAMRLKLDKVCSRERSQELQRRRRSRSRSPCYNPNAGICWYHWRFRQRSTRCTPPCNWRRQ
ncbi:hypothetical protein WH47_06068 [Habropoda laboriosa]|uniref:DUF7041 domain-containing protein n=1 Tax=Habropoda laboriosa TaxID=597456 RepID=A0A0L7QS28_9HYME|nr:hypothetical protein WH47_06068 [Habropoda laboriosa]